MFFQWRLVLTWNKDLKPSISPTCKRFSIPRASLTSSTLSRVQTCSLPSRLGCSWRGGRLSCSRILVLTRVCSVSCVGFIRTNIVSAGGVTSSSLEVLAGLALSTQEYVDLMIFKDAKPSEFYQSYVKDIQQKISENAAAEFQCIWREHSRLQGVKPRTTISDELSSTLNNLQAELESSDLFDDLPSRYGVMKKAIPKTLVDKIGLETLLKRLPETYQRALFSSWLASRFVSVSFLFSLFFFDWVLMDLCRKCNRSTSMASMPRVSTFSTLLGISPSR